MNFLQKMFEEIVDKSGMSDVYSMGVTIKGVELEYIIKELEEMIPGSIKFKNWAKKTEKKLVTLRIENILIDRAEFLKGIGEYLDSKNIKAEYKDVYSLSSAGHLEIKADNHTIRIVAKKKAGTARGNEDVVNKYFSDPKSMLEMPNGEIWEVDKIVGEVKEEGAKASAASLADITLKFKNGKTIDFSVKQKGSYFLMNHKNRDQVYEFYKDTLGETEAKKKVKEIDEYYLDSIKDGKVSNKSPMVKNIDAQSELELLKSAAGHRKRGNQKVDYVLSAPKSIKDYSDIKVYEIDSKEFEDYFKKVKVSKMLRSYDPKSQGKMLVKTMMNNYAVDTPEEAVDEYVADFVEKSKRGLAPIDLFPKWMYNGSEARFQVLGFDYNVVEK